MSKGGGGDQVVRQESLPEYAEPYVTSIMQRAESESYRDYQPYGGERLAGTAPETGAAYDLVRGMGPGIPGLGAAQQMTGQAAMRAGQIGQQGPSQFNQYGYSRMGPGPGIGGDLTNYQGAFGGRQPRQYGFQNVQGSDVGGQYSAGQARGIVGSGLADFRAPQGGQYRFQDAEGSDVGSQYSAGQARRIVGAGLADFRAPQGREYRFQRAEGSDVGGPYSAGMAGRFVGSDLAKFNAPRGSEYRFQDAQTSDVGGPYSAGQARRFVGSGLADFRAPKGREYRFDDVGQFTSKAAQKYMSPYMQNVVDVEKDRAQLDFERAQSGRDAAAVQAGAFGGSRGAVENALAQEALGRRQGEIQATGQQAAYEDAQRMFGADREAEMRREAERAGEAGRIQDYRLQGAGLQADTQMGAQRLAAQLYGSQQQLEQAAFEGDRQAQMLIDQQRASETGRVQDYRMQGEGLRVQTRMDAQRLASQLYGGQQQLEQAAFEGDRQAKMLIDQQQAGEAGRLQDYRMQGAGLQADTQMNAQRLASQLYGSQQQLEQAAFEGDRQAKMLIDQQRAGEFGRSQDYRMQGAGLQAETRMNAQRLASQIYGGQQQLEQAAFEGDRQAQMLLDQQRAGEFGRAQELGARETGAAAQQRLAAQQAQADIFDRYRSQDFAGQQAQAAELARVQAARDASRLGFGELGLSALGQQGQLAGQLGELGGRERDAATQYAEMLQGIGDDRRANQQQYLDLAYQDFLAQQQYPMEQLQAFNDIIRGNIRGGSTTQQQFTQANPFRDLLGAGITGLSLANMGG